VKGGIDFWHPVYCQRRVKESSFKLLFDVENIGNFYRIVNI
jgi:hypothetical protein